MIPGFLITWVTFPGVIVHELAHALFCRLFGLKLFEVKYMQFVVGFGQPAGYVIHEPAKEAWKNVLVGLGPFFVNTTMGAIIAAPGAIPVLKFDSRDPLDLLLCWLGVSVAMHAFPSTGDAASMWQSLTQPETPLWTKALGFPTVGLIYLGAIGSIFWLDLIFGVAVAGFLPQFIISILA